MSNARVKLTVGAILVSLALGLIAFAGVREARLFYVEVDTFLAESRFHDARVRLCGAVAEEGLDIDRSNMVARFALLGRAGRVAVVYKGLVPDMFRPGGEVVVEGRLDPSGVFQASQLITKCASKYKPADYPGAEAGG